MPTNGVHGGPHLGSLELGGSLGLGGSLRGPSVLNVPFAVLFTNIANTTKRQCTDSLWIGHGTESDKRKGCERGNWCAMDGLAHRIQRKSRAAANRIKRSKKQQHTDSAAGEARPECSASSSDTTML